MLFNLLKKALGIILLGIGIGILLVLLLPMAGWLFIVGVAMAVIGFVCISS